jgi:phage gpG-like protein
VKITLTDNHLIALKQFEDGLAQYRRRLELQTFRALTLLEAEVKQNLRKGAGLHVRSGKLLNSWTKDVRDDGGFIYGELKSEGVPYAAIHEYGGTIVPKNKQYLTIPSEFNRRPDGLPKLTTADLMGGLGKSFIRNGVIFLQEGKNKITPMFYLKKSVDIPARPYLATAVASKQEQIFKEFGLLLDVAFPSKG